MHIESQVNDIVGLEDIAVWLNKLSNDELLDIYDHLIPEEDFDEVLD